MAAVSRWSWWTWAGALASVACAGARVPPQQFERVTAAIRAAEAAGARDTPQAALQVAFSRERLQRAEQLSEQGEREAAERLLDEATVDAELAALLVRERQALRRSSEAEQQLELEEGL
jgi:Domain of unknown function (DUF4398)